MGHGTVGANLLQRLYGDEETLGRVLAPPGIQFSRISISGGIADPGLYNLPDLMPATTEAATYTAAGAPVSAAAAELTRPISVHAILRRIVLGATLLMPVLAQGAEASAPLRVYAAGSLTGAFNALLTGFGTPPGAAAQPTYGPSGLLRERLERGEPADLFASADLGQPQRLVDAGRGTPVVLFARNRMCALARGTLGLTEANLLDRLLDPATKLATSTPGADPGGDYAWAVFARAEQVRPGARATLEAKAQQLVGGPSMAPLMPGRGASEGVFLSGRADVMLAYCSGAETLRRTLLDLAAVPLPAELEVAPEYGMTVLSANPAAARFALFVMSEPGQAILARHGLIPVAARRRLIPVALPASPTPPQ